MALRSLPAGVGFKLPLECAEIGYWATCHTRGNVTNALTKLVTAASNVVFKRLVGYVKPDNKKSMEVLERVGFMPDFIPEQREGYQSLSRTI